MKVSTFDQLPQKATGSILVDMLIPALNRMGEKKRSYLASCRVLRGLIAVELQKRRTGVYPDSPNDLPIDPFTSQPLKYRKGRCEITRYYAKWVPYETEEEDEEAKDVESSSDGLWTLEDKTETVNAVQIWSVGPDGIDDGGQDSVKGEDSDARRMDDIRFIIPIH